jgi:hypothetical protein
MSQSRRRAVLSMASLPVLVLAPAASAATQGSYGPSSRGSITITASIAAPARIAGLTDFALDGAAEQELCFTGAPHTYTVAAAGSDGMLALSNGADRIPYRVEWLPHAGDGGNASLTVRAVGNRADCGPDQGAGRLRIAFESPGAARVEGGAPYSGTLVLLLAPE